MDVEITKQEDRICSGSPEFTFARQADATVTFIPCLRSQHNPRRQQQHQHHLAERSLVEQAEQLEA